MLQIIQAMADPAGQLHLILENPDLAIDFLK